MSTATLRPNATTVAAGSVTGAASEHAALADDSDSSYATGNTGTYQLGTVAMGSGAITKNSAIRWRGRSSSSDTPDVTITAPGVTTLITYNAPQGGAAYADATSGYKPISLTQAQVDALTMSFTSIFEGALTDLDLLELYLYLVYVTKPSTSVTAVSPDPYTASTIVPIAWTNTLDLDGGGQTRYEIKVFTDAQYGAGGFDPDTSTPYWTSGEIVSALTTADAGPLENADTYRAYVRVAQTVNGVSHWSAWAYDEFTMSVTTSEVDTVTAVATDASGLITVTVAWDALSTGWEYIQVQRSIDAGATWVDVRGATIVATADSGATDHVVVDYEAPNGTSVLYQARAIYYSSGVPITGSWVQSSAESWSSTDCWLKAPDDPTLNVTFRYAGRDPYRRSRRSGVFDVLGAASPVVVSDVRSSRRGRFGVETLTSGTADGVTSLLEGSAVLLVQYPASMDIDDAYVAVLSDEEQFVSQRADVVQRVWTLDYVEVAAPADPDAGSL